MKKLITLIALLGLATVGWSQSFQSQKLINATSIQVSNKTWAVTNILAGTELWSALTARTNMYYLEWTNNLGVSVTNGNSPFDSVDYRTFNLLGDAKLFSYTTGQWPFPSPHLTNDVAVAGGLQYSPLNVSVSLVGEGSAADSAVNFVFAPVPNGTDNTTGLSTWWTFPVVANGANRVTASTNLPMWLWPGCKSIRLMYINNTDQTAASAVWVTDVSVNGFVP